MKKFFLIPLMALMCSVAAWGITRTAGTFDELKTALSEASEGDVIELTADIDYGTAGTNYLNITKSITLDGQGHTLTGACKRAAVDFWATLYVNEQAEDVAMIDVVIKDITLVNNKQTSDYGASIRFQHNINTATLTNVVMDITGGVRSNSAPMFLGGSDTNNPTYTLNNCKLLGKNSDYPYYSWIKAHIIAKDSYFNGYCGMYFKDGSNGTIVDADNCNFDAPNEHNGTSNAFACFACEDGGITLNLNNCGMNAKQLGDQNQALVLASSATAIAKRANNIIVNISGDNSYFNCGGGMNQLIQNNWYWGSGAPLEEYGDIVLTMTGGTFSIDPREIQWYGQWADLATYDINVLTTTIPDGYEVSEIETQQGDQKTTLYRVRKKVETAYQAEIENPDGNIVSYTINADVEAEGEGQNANTDFKISADETVNVPSNAVVANYVEVSNNATLTVPEGKSLAVTNGLDVTDGAQVVVESGSTVMVGEGGIVAESTESIVIEANENGAASLLLDPKVIVNTTPNLTVEMTAQQVGYKAKTSGEGYDYYWHRFAMPVDQIEALPRTPSVGTNIKFWDYTIGAVGDWADVTGFEELNPFVGYNMTVNSTPLQDVVYTFKGKLVGNTNNPLVFNKRGFNFFGNSYTGYISLIRIVDMITGGENAGKLEGSVWVWNTEQQHYDGVSLEALVNDEDYRNLLQEHQFEIAPMQTFILFLKSDDMPDMEINYESAIWGNPRYSSITGVPAPTLAPARSAASKPAMRIEIAAANGKSDAVLLFESDKVSDASDNAYNVTKFMNEKTINAYTTIDGKNFSTLATNNLEGTTISLNTNEEIAYTLTFKFANCEEYALEDLATGKIIAIQEGTTYEFAAQPNSVVADRFRIVGVHKVPTSVETTEVKNGVKGIYTVLGQYVGEDFRTLPSGVYVVDGVKIVK